MRPSFVSSLAILLSDTRAHDVVVVAVRAAGRVLYTWRVDERVSAYVCGGRRLTIVTYISEPGLKM